MKTCINLFGMATVVLIVPAPFAAFDADHVRVVRDGADVLIESNGLPNHTSSYWSNTHERTLDGITTRTAETDHPLFVEPSCTSYDQMAPGNIDDFNGSYSMTVPAQPTRASFPATSPEARFIASSTTALVLALGLALAVALAVGGWLAGRTVRPLRTLTDAARAIAAGDLRQSVPVTGAGELGALAEAFNTMSARLAEANTLRRRVTADVSHDLRTPVTAVLGTLELIETGAMAPTPERLRAARIEAERLARLVENFHTLAIADAGELPIHSARLNVTDALHHAATLFEAQARSAGIDVTVEADEVPDVYADPDRLAQILANVIANALRHTPSGGRIVLGARRTADGVEVAVADTGSGIPLAVLPHVFERSVRADAARSGRGAGLGLSIVRTLTEAMGGTVGVQSAPGAGTTITLTLLAWRNGSDAQA